MSTRKARHAEYERTLQLLGKDLARRARSRCELSGDGPPLETVDLDPTAEDAPDLDRVVLVARPVAEMLRGGAIAEQEVRYLSDLAWTPLPPVREAVARLLARIDAAWAREALENLEMMRGAAESDSH